MKILLLPSFHYEKDLYLNLLYIAHFLEKRGYRVVIFDVNKYYDEDREEVRMNELVRNLLDVVRDVDLVGLSSYKMYVENDREIFNIIRSVRPDVPVVIGGWGPTQFPVEYLHLFKPGPTILARGVHGQGLKAFLELVELFNKYSELPEDELKSIRSLGFIDRRGEVVLTPLGDVMSSEELPVIDWHIERFGLDPNDYITIDGAVLVPVICAVASCPKYYREPCLYCSIGKIVQSYKQVYGEQRFYREVAPKLTKVTLDRVVLDIKNALSYFKHEQNVTRFSITIVDDCVLPHVLMQLIRKLDSEGILDHIASIKFQTRPEYVGKILERVRAECPEAEPKLVIDVGIEFFTNEDLLFTRRGYDVNTALKCLEELSRSSARWTIYVILTTPRSSAEDLARNIETALEWIEKTYLLRTNPFLFEEGTSIPDVVGSNNIVYKQVDSVKIPVRPRFLADLDELRKMLEVVEYYISYVSELRERTMIEIAKAQDYEAKYRKFLIYQSLSDLLESLEYLRAALQEDIEYYQSRLSSSSISNGALSSPRPRTTQVV